MPNRNLIAFLFISFISGAALLTAQPKPEADTITFTSGEKLAGHFVSANASSVTFKSDILGDLTVDWSKVKELQTSAAVAVVPKGVKIHKRGDVSAVPQGTLAESNQTIQLTPPNSIPVGDVNVVIDQPSFQKAVTETPNFFRNWKGALTAGASLVEATQNSRTFTGGVALVRTEPTQSWMDPNNRTAINFAESYGEVTQPNTPTVKTSIFHFDAQRDEYFTHSMFAFAEGALDHNYSQGLDLQQTYNGGIGWSPINTANQNLNLKASMSYTRQQFSVGPSMNLIGSVFGEDYMRKLPRGMVFTERGSVTPAWNNTDAYSAAFSALLTIPVFKRLSGSMGVIDSFLNDPPPGFKKNSFQFTLGVAYSIQ